MSDKPPSNDLEEFQLFIKSTWDYSKSAVKGFRKNIKHPNAPAWIQAITAIVMMGTLFFGYWAIRQNEETIRNTQESIKIEQETRLNPELECSYDWTKQCFVFRNVGNATAANIYLRTDVYCLVSNNVISLYPYNDGGRYENPLDKLTIPPGKYASCSDGNVPDMKQIYKFWAYFNGEILIRIYISYDRLDSSYKHYSGYANFTFISEFGKRHDIPDAIFKSGSFTYLTEEEYPYLTTIIDKFNNTPKDQFEYAEPYTNNTYWVGKVFARFGVGAPILQSDDGDKSEGSWSKIH